jgi:hypothetical protein
MFRLQKISHRNTNCVLSASKATMIKLPLHLLARLKEYVSKNHVRWVPCQHGMAHPQVADEGDGL